MAVSPMRQAFVVCRKDLVTEFRQRTSINAVLLFAVTSVVVVGFGLAGLSLPADSAIPLLWIVLFFAAFSGLAHVFTEEEEAATSDALRMAAVPEAIFWGKFLYNLVLLMLTALIVVPLYLAAVDLSVPDPLRFTAVVAAGTAALASAATAVGAIVARARARGALFGALGFPVVLPLIMMAVVATRRAVGQDPTDWLWMREVGGLAAYAGAILAASVLVFPFIWESS